MTKILDPRRALTEGRAVRVIVTYCDPEIPADEWLETYPTTEAARLRVEQLRKRHTVAYRVHATTVREALDLGANPAALFADVIDRPAAEPATEGS